MGNPLYNMLNSVLNKNQNNNMINIINQAKQLQNNPGMILDILAQNGKITQQQYNELQPYRNNPQAIYNYLFNHGNADQLNQAQQQASMFNGQL